MKLPQYVVLCLMISAALLTACDSPRPEITIAQPEEPEPAEEFHAEVLPPHLAYRVEDTESAVVPGPITGAARGVINGLKAWPPELRTLRVCFFGALPSLRQQIVSTVNHWIERPVGVSFDFGTAPTYRTCTRDGDNHIRVGFAYAGYWSLVGQDSYLAAHQAEQSMNFGQFLVRPPREPEFSRVVLHEFGHALGFEHEHQSAWSKCEDEFDWEAIYPMLAGPPNYWSKETVDFNMRRLSADNLVLSRFDKLSIMLYTFDKKFYKKNIQLECYSEGNNSISDGDFALLASVYPTESSAREAARATAANEYVIALQSMEGGAEKNVAALTELLKYTQGELPKGALKGVPASQLSPALRSAKPME